MFYSEEMLFGKLMISPPHPSHPPHPHHKDPKNSQVDCEGTNIWSPCWLDYHTASEWPLG